MSTSAPLHAQFFLNGDAYATNDSCYQLTYDRNFSSGSIWNPDKIDLRQSFDVVVNVFLGCKDADGADGIVFGFQPVSTSIGGAGEGIGFQGIVPSLGIEMDTWQNTNLGDPPYDHIAIIRDGDMNHNSRNTLAGPVQMHPNKPNVEDCEFHELRVSWDARAKTIEVYFDCFRRLSYTGDIVNEIFRGDPFVFWGFTSATGGANNIHQVCLTYTTFLDQLDDVVMCPGGQVLLKARGGVRYEWTPGEGLSNPRGAVTFAAPRQTTLYQVEITDECGRGFFDEALVEVAGDSVFFDLGPADTMLCEGQTLRLDATTPAASYSWLDGATTPTRMVVEAGYYEVTVTRTDTFCVANDAIAVTYTRLPRVDLGPADTVLCRGKSMTLRAAFPGAEYHWHDGSRADSFVVRRAGYFEVAVSNPCGVAIDGIHVAVDRCDKAYIPNAFSPNGDGRNERLRVYHGGDVVWIGRMQVFDRWGELVYDRRDFSPDDPDAGWDGVFRDRPAPPGVYLYVVEMDFRDGGRARRAGSAHLVR